MTLEKSFSDEQLMKIVDQATIYMCACPAQVAEIIRHLRHLDDYQTECLGRSTGELSQRVHERIGRAANEAHQLMEACLQEVLHMEGWNSETLEMPPGLRQLQQEELKR